jgi:hypothetical protein
MEWRQLSQLVQGLGDGWVDPDWIAEALSTMNDSVPHGSRRWEGGDGMLDLALIDLPAANLEITACDQGVVSIEHPELETARSGVDAEDAQSSRADRLAEAQGPR